MTQVPRFWWWFVLVLLVATGAQSANVAAHADDLRYDGPLYVSAGRLLAEGEGFIGADALFFSGVRRESAFHPPLNAMWLSLRTMAGGEEHVDYQWWEVIPGVLAVALTLLAARHVGGDVVGLVAGGLAAVHPAVWSYPATVMAETLAQLAAALLLLATYRWWSAPTLRWAGVIGAAAGLATLSRSEGIVLLPVLLVAMHRHRGLVGRRVGHLLVAATWWLALVGPWLLFNQVRFEEPVTTATGVDWALVSSNCWAAATGPDLGYWFLGCRPFNDVQYDEDGQPLDESTENLILREKALDFVRQHPEEMPRVVAARIARSLSLWWPRELAEHDEWYEGRDATALLAGTALTYLLAVPAVAGARRLRRDGWTVAPAVALLVAAVGGAAVTHGTTRYRAGLELAIVLLAAVAIVGWMDDRGRSARLDPHGRLPAEAPGRGPQGHDGEHQRGDEPQRSALGVGAVGHGAPGAQRGGEPERAGTAQAGDRGDGGRHLGVERHGGDGAEQQDGR